MAAGKLDPRALVIAVLVPLLGGCTVVNPGRAEGEAKAAIARAEGEAKANEVLAQSITPSLLQWRQLQITEQAVGRWNGVRPMVEGQSSGLLLQLPAITQASR